MLFWNRIARLFEQPHTCSYKTTKRPPATTGENTLYAPPSDASSGVLQRRGLTAHRHTRAWHTGLLFLTYWLCVSVSPMHAAEHPESAKPRISAKDSTDRRKKFPTSSLSNRIRKKLSSIDGGIIFLSAGMAVLLVLALLAQLYSYLSSKASKKKPTPSAYRLQRLNLKKRQERDAKGDRKKEERPKGAA